MPKNASKHLAFREIRRPTSNDCDAFHAIGVMLGTVTCSEADIYRLVYSGVSLTAFTRVACALGLPRRLIVWTCVRNLWPISR